MRFGLSINDSFAAALDDATWAESAALDLIAIPDHLLREQATDPALAGRAPAPEPFVQLAAIAMATSRIELATLSSPITFRHPAILLKAAIELSVVSGGRFTLGLGTGYRRAEHETFGIPFPSTADRYGLLEDALGYISAGRSRPNPGYRGTRYRLRAQEIAPHPHRLRILVGGSGPTRTPVLAGRYADEFNVFTGPVAGVRQRIETARAARSEPRDLDVSISAPLVVGRTRRDLAREADRQAVRRGMTGEQYLARQRASGTALVGSPADVAECLLSLEAAGVRACYFVFDGNVDRDGVLAVRDAVQSA